MYNNKETINLMRRQILIWYSPNNKASPNGNAS